MTSQLGNSLRAGFSGIAAYSLWGLFPLYWHALSAVPAHIILAHRIVWSFAFVFLFVRLSSGLLPIRLILMDRKLLLPLLLSSVLISTNWLVYILAVHNGRILECSLGYFITPILTVALGVHVLKERLRGLQMIALLAVIVGIAIRTTAYGDIPWYGLLLAVSFSLYGLIRKRCEVSSSHGLLVETMWLFPLAGSFIIFVEATGMSPVRTLGPTETVLLLSSGLITAVPLGLFAIAARGMTLTSLSIIQYLSPSLQFLLGIFVFHEPVTTSTWAAFGCVWAGVLCFLADAIRRKRKSSELSRPLSND